MICRLLSLVSCGHRGFHNSRTLVANLKRVEPRANLGTIPSCALHLLWRLGRLAIFLYAQEAASDLVILTTGGRNSLGSSERLTLTQNNETARAW